MLKARVACTIRRIARLALVLHLWLAIAFAQETGGPLELSRAVRSWEFLPVVGTRAALFGNEAGPIEAWVYPLKLLRNFRLNFLVAGQSLPAQSLARSVTVRPESSTIAYSGDTFSVEETLFVPVRGQGAVVKFDVRTAEPLEIEAVFERDLQLEWPAALGGTFINWDPRLHAFVLGEEQKKYAGIVGSPTAVEVRQEYSTNYFSSRDNAFRLGVSGPGRDTKTIVIAGSTDGVKQAESTYDTLSSHYDELSDDATQYYRSYLSTTLGVDIPDEEIERSYNWSRISMLQGLVANPDLGSGLVAGYRSSGDWQRPGFAWFFGRDSLWTALALDAEGDFRTSRTTLEFLGKYQRADGKIEHEISQTAAIVPWFTNYPYAYASADATPLFIVAADDYVTRSGDLGFLMANWEKLWKAYQFLKSTYGEKGFPQNTGVGHGWVEGGALLPVRAEMYQVGLGTAALRSLAHLAALSHNRAIETDLNKEFTQQKLLLNQMFWSEEKGLYGFAVGMDDARIDTPSVLATVPMWFGLLDPEKAERMLNLLASPDHQADWGMRIISSLDPKYNPGGYHFGSVWPLFTGWASVGEYRYHRAFPAYSNLRANALLALNGSLGHVTEVLSGDYFEPLSTSSPHQIWSAAMVVSPILRGMLGIEVDAAACTVRLSPHVPADWTYFRVRNLPVGQAHLNLSYRKTESEVSLEVQGNGHENCALDFAPALSLHAKVLGADVNGHAVAVHVDENSEDQHAVVRLPLQNAATVVRLRVRDDFGLALHSGLPSLGSSSQGLRVISESWSRDRSTLTLETMGAPGQNYSFAVWGAAQITSVQGGEVKRNDRGETTLLVHFPHGAREFQAQQVRIQFAPR
jgi:glycogen debranching enzyme